jgi:hypothetical protein
MRFLPDSIFANMVVANQIGVNQLNASEITALELTAGNARIGKLKAGAIDAAAITAGVITAGAITSDRLTIRSGSLNDLENSTYTLWRNPPDSDTPQQWGHYDNGGTTGTATWSRVANGAPGAIFDSWRLVASGCNANKGFMSNRDNPYAPDATSMYKWLPNEWYTISFWWKGNSQPEIASNGNRAIQTWVPGFDPTVDPPSTTVWKRYAQRIKMDASGGHFSGGDYVYVWPATPNVSSGASVDVQIALPQRELGDMPTSWSQFIDPVVIEGGTITAGTFQTARTGARTVLNNQGLRYIESSGSVTVDLSASAGGLTLMPDTVNVGFPPAASHTIRWRDPGLSNAETLRLESNVGLYGGEKYIYSTISVPAPTGGGLLVERDLFVGTYPGGYISGGLNTTDAYLRFAASSTQSLVELHVLPSTGVPFTRTLLNSAGHSDFAGPTASYGCSVARTIGTSQTVMIYNTVRWDDTNSYNTTNGRYVVPQNGKYRVTVGFRWGDATDVSCNVGIRKNGTLYKWLGQSMAPQASAWGMSLSGMVDANAGEYLEVVLTVNSGTRATSADTTTNWVDFVWDGKANNV